MYTKTTKVFILAVALLTSGFSLAYAAGHMDTTASVALAGKVLFMDADAGLLWLQSRNGDVVKMTAPTKLIKGLSKGESIRFSITNTEQFANHHNKAPFDKMVSARVQNVDAATKLIRLKTEGGEIIDMNASDKLRNSLREGESVVVDIHIQS